MTIYEVQIADSITLYVEHHPGDPYTWRASMPGGGTRESNLGRAITKAILRWSQYGCGRSTENPYKGLVEPIAISAEQLIEMVRPQDQSEVREMLSFVR